MFNLDGLFSMVLMLICLVLAILFTVLKLAGLLLLGWGVIAVCFALTAVFLILGCCGVW